MRISARRNQHLIFFQNISHTNIELPPHAKMPKATTFTGLSEDGQLKFVKQCVATISAAVLADEVDGVLTNKNMAKLIEDDFTALFPTAAFKKGVWDGIFKKLKAYVYANPKAAGCDTLISTTFEDESVTAAGGESVAAGDGVAAGEEDEEGGHEGDTESESGEPPKDGKPVRKVRAAQLRTRWAGTLSHRTHAHPTGRRCVEGQVRCAEGQGRCVEGGGQGRGGQGQDGCGRQGATACARNLRLFHIVPHSHHLPLTAPPRQGDGGSDGQVQAHQHAVGRGEGAKGGHRQAGCRVEVAEGCGEGCGCASEEGSGSGQGAAKLCPDTGGVESGGRSRRARGCGSWSVAGWPAGEVMRLRCGEVKN